MRKCYRLISFYFSIFPVIYQDHYNKRESHVHDFVAYVHEKNDHIFFNMQKFTKKTKILKRHRIPHRTRKNRPVRTISGECKLSRPHRQNYETRISKKKPKSTTSTLPKPLSHFSDPNRADARLTHCSDLRRRKLKFWPLKSTMRILNGGLTNVIIHFNVRGVVASLLAGFYSYELCIVKWRIAGRRCGIVRLSDGCGCWVVFEELWFFFVSGVILDGLLLKMWKK